MVLQWIVVFLMAGTVVHGQHLTEVDCEVSLPTKAVKLTAATAFPYITIPNCAGKVNMPSPATINFADCSNIVLGQKFLVWVHTADGFYAPPADKTVEVICTLDTNPVEVTQTMGVTTTEPAGSSTGVIAPKVNLIISLVAGCTGTSVTTANYADDLFLCLHMTSNYATHFGTQFLKVVAFIVGSSPSVEQTLTDLKCSQNLIAATVWAEQEMMVYPGSSTATLKLAAKIPFKAFFLTGKTLPLKMGFRVTAARCNGECGDPGCPARKRRSVDDFDEDLEPETVTTSLTINMSGATDDDQNEQQNGSTDDVCINKGGFYGLLTFMAVSLLIAVLASGIMFMRARKSRMPLDERDLYYKEKNCSHNPAFRG